MTGKQTSKIDPLFDGHLERPFEDMTTDERLDWAWEMMCLWHWARNHVHPVEARSEDVADSTDDFR